MPLDDCVRLDTRLAGQIRRYHSWPVHKNQSIAEHTWQMLRIYMCVCQKPDPHIMFHIMFHDIGEHYTGDIPYPVKSENPQLKELMDMLEQRSWATQLDYWDCFHQSFVNDEDKALCKMIELVEMAEFGMDEVAFGNAHGMIITIRCLKAVFNQRPPPNLAEYIIKRINIFSEQCPTVKNYDYCEWLDPVVWRKTHGYATHEISGTNSQGRRAGVKSERSNV